MARFKPNDRVEVIADNANSATVFSGDRGEVISVSGSSEYNVMMDNGGTWYFRDGDLRKVGQSTPNSTGPIPKNGGEALMQIVEETKRATADQLKAILRKSQGMIIERRRQIDAATAQIEMLDAVQKKAVKRFDAAELDDFTIAEINKEISAAETKSK